MKIPFDMILDDIAPLALFTVTIKGVISSAGNVLMLRKANGRWELVGGKLDMNEDPIDGLKREVFEETGLSIDIERVVDACVRPRPIKLSTLTVTYLCKPLLTVPPISLSHEHVAFGFFSPDELALLPMTEGTRASLAAGAQAGLLTRTL